MVRRKQILKTMALIGFAGPLVVSVLIVLVFTVAMVVQELLRGELSLVLAMEAGEFSLFILFMGYFVGFVAALLAAGTVGFLLWRQGEVGRWKLLLIGFVSGFVGFDIMMLTGKGAEKLLSLLQGGLFGGFLGLLAALLLLPFLQRLKIVARHGKSS